METERDRLSTALDFEAAAQQHAKIAKLKGILGIGDELCRRVEQIDAFIVQPSVQTGSVALFRFHRGELAGPHIFAVENKAVENQAESRSLEDRIREALDGFVPEGARSALQFTEELAILKRWYYRTHKAGEIVLANEKGELSVRKIANVVRRISGTEKISEAAEPKAVEQQPLSPEA
jgi:hypothetical protein